jgi:hypothetical protein
MSHVGLPSVRGMIRQYEQANYTLEKALYEMIDNAILRSTRIRLQVNDQISVSDNIAEGFADILKQGTSNPFNFTHIREGQDDDQETSQFGVGLKAGAIALAGRLDVYTRVGQCYRVIFDFHEMSRLDTFEPVIATIPVDEYQAVHPYPEGSTLVFSQLRYKDMDLPALAKEIQDTYGDLLREFTVTGPNYTTTLTPVPSLYTHPLCAPFTQTWKIYKNGLYFIRKIDEDDEDVFDQEYEVFDQELLKKKSRPTLASLLKGAVDCGTIQTTMTKFYHDEEGGELPYNSIHLYRNKRCYGKWDHTYKTRNGAKNYVQSRLDLRSKELAKLLGLTFNKSISDDIVNTETCAFKEFIKHVTKGFNTDKNSPLYAKLETIAREAGILTNPSKPDAMTRVKYLRGDVPEASRLSMAEYIQQHPEISKEKEFKTLFNRMIQHGWIPGPE